jgi:hypothetical protein
VLFLTWDEGSAQADDPPMIVISPHAKPGHVSHTPYDTSSYLKTVQNALGLAELPCAAAAERGTVETMADLFTVPMTAAGS